MKSLTDQLKIQIEKLTVKLADSRESLTYWEITVDEQQTELWRLQNALAALEGKTETKFPELMAPQVAPMTYRMAAPPPSEMVTLNGEKIILEPGYKVGKNSFGEDCIVPLDAADYPTMAEPTKPAPTTHGVILPATNETLDRPEDLL